MTADKASTAPVTTPIFDALLAELLAGRLTTSSARPEPQAEPDKTGEPVRVKESVGAAASQVAG